jgi:ketosteroid isomerase-like protein
MDKTSESSDEAAIRKLVETWMAASKRSGWTLTILRKDGGRWRLARDANLVR